MSVGAVNKQTGDRIPTAGMPAIDNALDLTSSNPVQNAVITAALADKQDKSDNNLQTTDKTVVGAVNELKNGLTNVDIELSVPAGTGKNIFNKDDADNLTGRALNSETGVPYVASGWMTTNFIKIEPSTAYTLTTTSVSSSVAFYDSEQVYISGASSFGTKTTPSNAKYLRFDYKSENAAIMQLEKGTTATAYVPYIPSVESRIEAVESGLTDVSINLTSIINQVGGIYVFRRNTSSSAASVTFTYTGIRYAGLFFSISNSGKCSVYAVTYNNSGTTKSYLEKLAGDTLGSLVINNDNGNISADMSNWSSCILIVSDSNFTVS